MRWDDAGLKVERGPESGSFSTASGCTFFRRKSECATVSCILRLSVVSCLERAARELIGQRLTLESPYSRRAAEFSTTMTLRGVHAEA